MGSATGNTRVTFACVLVLFGLYWALVFVAESSRTGGRGSRGAAVWPLARLSRSFALPCRLERHFPQQKLFSVISASACEVTTSRTPSSCRNEVEDPHIVEVTGSSPVSPTTPQSPILQHIPARIGLLSWASVPAPGTIYGLSSASFCQFLHASARIWCKHWCKLGSDLPAARRRLQLRLADRARAPLHPVGYLRLLRWKRSVTIAYT